MKRWKIMPLTLALWLILFACSSVSKDTAATVNKQEVSLDEMSYLVARGVQEVEAFTMYPIRWDEELDGLPVAEYLKHQALDAAVTYQVIAQKASELELGYTKEDRAALEHDIQDEIEAAGGEEEFDDMLRRETMTRAVYAYYMREIPELSDRLFESFFGPGGQQYPSDAEVRDFFVENYLHASYILLSTLDEEGLPVDDAQMAERRGLGEELLARLADGEDFFELVRTYGEDFSLSEDPSGFYFAKGTMGDDFDNAAFALPENGVSGLVECPYGLYIIMRLPFDEEYVRENFDLVRRDLSEIRYQALLEGWKKDVKVKTYPPFDTLNPMDFESKG